MPMLDLRVVLPIYNDWLFFIIPNLSDCVLSADALSLQHQI